MKKQIITIIVIALSIAGCNDSKKSDTKNAKKNTEETSSKELSSNEVLIENTKWVITKLEGGDMSDREANGQDIYFMLDAKTNRINGNSGCNTFMGTYKIENSKRISFSQLASTRMMCPDAKINESQILNVFETADNFAIQNGKLSLNKAKRAPLAEFKKVESTNEPIVEKYWKLKILEGQDVKMAENQEREIFFTLKNDNRVTGFAGCNTISGAYTLEDGNRIKFNNIATTLKACPDVNVDEAGLLNVFNIADNYTINGDVLSLNVGRRAPLAVFEAVYMQ